MEALIVIAIITFIYMYNQAKKKMAQEQIDAAKRAEKLNAIEEAGASYQKTLEKLKANPTNANLRQEALNLGRYYFNLCRSLDGDGGVTIYDETALMNDLNAVSTGSYAPSNSSDSSDSEERLTKLADLWNKGLITENEYYEKRKKILDSM